MRLFGAISKVDELDDGTVRVHGIASTEDVDDQGEVVRSSAIKDALPDYLRFPALREMHQLSAAGTTLEANVGDDSITRIVAHVVDPVAISKVKNKVYRGFSIGGRVTKREPGNPKTITGLVLNEISLVDRPANPSATFDCWKASNMDTAVSAQPFNPLPIAALSEPEQIWRCNIPGHTHTAKSDARKCIETAAEMPAEHTAQTVIDAARKAIETAEGSLRDIDAEQRAEANEEPPEEAQPLNEAQKASDDDSGKKPYGNVTYADPGHQSDGKKRYPIDTEEHIRAAWNYINKPKNAGKYSSGDLASIKARIVAAWKSKIDKDGPPSAKKALTVDDLRKAMMDIGYTADLISMLRAMHQRLQIEAVMEGEDDSSSQVVAACRLLCEFLVNLVAEETREVLEGSEIPEPVIVPTMSPMAMSVVTESLQKTFDTEIAEALVQTLTQKVGRRHNRGDQALLDEMALQCHKAMNSADCAKSDVMGYHLARKAVLDAGATDIAADGREMLDGESKKVPMKDAAEATEHSTTDTGRNASTTAPNPTGKVPAKPEPGGEAMTGKAADEEDASDAIARAAARLTAAGVPGHVVLELTSEAGQMAKAGMKKSHVHGYLAHAAMKAFSAGSTCDEGMPMPNRHNKQDMANIHEAHKTVLKCDGMAMVCKAFNAIPGGMPDAAGEEEGQGTRNTAGKTANGGHNDDLRKALAYQEELNVTLTKSLNDAVSVLSRLNERLERVEQTPLPGRALRIATPGSSISKSADNRMPEIDDDRQMSPADIAKALSRLSPEDQSLTLVRAARSQPKIFPGINDERAPRPIDPRAAQRGV